MSFAVRPIGLVKGGFVFVDVITSDVTNYNLRARAVAAGWDQVVPLVATTWKPSATRSPATLTARGLSAFFTVSTTVPWSGSLEPAQMIDHRVRGSESHLARNFPHAGIDARARVMRRDEIQNLLLSRADRLRHIVFLFT